MQHRGENIEITTEFSRALSLMEGGGPPLFITGRAGTGKSTLLRLFRDNSRKSLAIVAPTGAAAVNVQGETIHSFFRLPPRPIGADDVKEMKDKRLWQSLDAIVIDEVSMVRADVMDGIDRFLRKNGKHEKRPFGGIQMVFIGDLYQLPPVIASEEERFFLQAHYVTPYFYSAAAFESGELKIIELQRVFRQQDDVFIGILNAVRNAELEALHLDQLNMRVQPRFVPPQDAGYVTLTTTNRRARQINDHHLSQLRTPEREYEGIMEGDVSPRSFPADEVLYLKEGAQVMFVKNDPEHRWINGTLGRIKKLGRDVIEVDILEDDEAVEVKPTSWEILKYRYDADKKRVEAEVQGKFTQFPLMPAYAITIHKSQGKTFDRVVIDLTGGTFAHGQAYVALSRCRTLDGIVLRRPFYPRDVRLDKDVLSFGRAAPKNAAYGRLF